VASLGEPCLDRGTGKLGQQDGLFKTAPDLDELLP
jgi:hypothetical protein